MAHNEDTRVKIPAIIHLTRLGYEYFSLKDSNYQISSETNIITNIFRDQFLKLNKMDNKNENDLRIFENEFKNIALELGQDDL
jgi:type I restriction enzyme R subunit